MANRQTGKQRASRIPLDYFKTPDRLMRAKLSLTFLALIAALGWWASGLRPGGRGLLAESDSARMRYSHGPVAAVHASWDARCEACHVDFHPISDDSWTKAVGGSTKGADLKCLDCHQVEIHHQAQQANDPSDVSCAGCHRDHRGREASLVKLEDSDCTSCHKALDSHTKAGKSAFAAKVTSFPGDHPAFALFRQGKESAVDPGTLKFNHALHMAPGLTTVQGGSPIFRAGQLTSATARERYAPGKKPEDAVQLECASCHRLDNGALPSASSRSGVLALADQPLAGTGAYIKPITYQADCAACHALNVPMPQGEGTKVVTVPHRLQPSALHEALTNLSLGLTLEGDPALARKIDDGRRGFPGKSSAVEVSARKEIAARVAVAEKLLFGPGHNTCTECHGYDTPAGRKSSPDLSQSLDGVQIEPTYVPTIWFEHANFDHSAHRAVSCRSCHEDAFERSTTNADVLLPRMDVCASCHAPAGRDASGQPVGGAGHACTECHRYHGGDRKPGPSMARDVDALDIPRFLKGAP